MYNVRSFDDLIGEGIKLFSRFMFFLPWYHFFFTLLSSYPYNLFNKQKHEIVFNFFRYTVSES